MDEKIEIITSCDLHSNFITLQGHKQHLIKNEDCPLRCKSRQAILAVNRMTLQKYILFLFGKKYLSY